MTYTEPERLALELRELIERRARLHAMLRDALQLTLTDQERDDLQRVLDSTGHEKARLEARLHDLLQRKKP
jgi:hypothetical protein